MNLFPTVDPIPLPAPVWLLKALHIVTLILHFTAVQMLLGGLLVAIALSVWARNGEARTVANALARRLPIVMTYVINFGVPPLLFAQVLYGRTLYTSSVLMGVWWIAVIPLLIACYWLLYQFSERLKNGKTAWWIGLISWLLAGGIARIYSSNMTLMLRPEAWHGMYDYSPSGAFLPTGDPTLAFRWLFMLAGGLTMAGLWMLWLCGRQTFAEAERRFMAMFGGRLAAVGALIQAAAAIQVVRNQPAAVQSAMRQNAMYEGAAYVWMASVALIVLAGVWYGVITRSVAFAPIAAILGAALTIAGIVVYRDGIRDVTLLTKGFDVWQRTVVANWSFIAVFLVLFVCGLGAVAWLISVVARSKRVMETMA